MLVRRHAALLERVEVGPWSGQSASSGSDERCEVVGFYSGGVSIATEAVVHHRPRERERLLMTVLGGEGSEAEVGQVQEMLFRRLRALEGARAQLQQAAATLERAQ